jgi:hypothetical protein
VKVCLSPKGALRKIFGSDRQKPRAGYGNPNMWDSTICNDKKILDSIHGKESDGRNILHAWKRQVVYIMI